MKVWSIIFYGLDSFLDESLKQADFAAKARARILVSATLVSLSLGILSVASVMADIHLFKITFALLHLSCMIALLVLLKKGMELALLTKGLLGWFLISSSIDLSMHSSIFHTYYGWVPVLVAFSALMIDLRSSFILGGLIILQLTLFILIKQGNGADFESLVKNGYYLSMVSTIALSQIMMCSIAWCFEYFRETGEDTLQNQRAKAIHLARLVEIGELFQSILSEIKPNLDTLDNTLHKLQIVDVRQSYLLPDQKHGLQRTRQALDAIQFATRKMNEYALMERTQQRLPTSIQDIFYELHPFIRNEARRHRIQIRFADHSNNAQIVCDPQQILQAFRSLLTNSIEALEQQNEKIIRLESSLLDNQLIVKIRDNGSGIPPWLENRIFKPFFSTKEGTLARGLGLNLTQNILEDHGGSIALDRHEADTCFVIRLPLSTVAVEAEPCLQLSKISV